MNPRHPATGHGADDADDRRADGGPADDRHPFPAESEWLDLPIPDGATTAGGDLQSRTFVDRVAQALREERALDGALEALDRELPRIVLQAHTPPPPSADFVARTLAAARQDRRTHWQQMLARHVAPEPSPQFVEQTLAALRQDVAAQADAPTDGHAAGERAATGGLVITRSHGGIGSGRGGLGSAAGWRRLGWPLLAAAAGLVLWNALGRSTSPAFDARLVQHAAPAYAHAWASGPTGVVLAQRADRDDPTALASGTPDGLWLAFAEGRR